MDTYYICRVDTNEYSGNFVREMASFLTGLAGEYGGQEEADTARKEIGVVALDWFEENVTIQIDEDHGADEIALIEPTPGWSNDGNGKHFHDTKHKYPAYQSIQIRFQVEPPEHIRAILRERAEKFATSAAIKVSGVEFAKVEVTTSITILQ